ncbi:MAG: DUF2268 domain-containing protein [Bacteroidales bacterium]|nr:DUF2268 domain-containing protein [Bacteroidales bacterium]
MISLKKSIYILFGAAGLMLGACHHTPTKTVEIHRFDKLLFETPVEQLQSKLLSTGNEYSTELLNVHPNNPDFMQLLAGFVQDPTMQEVYRLADSVFGDMKAESEALGRSLAIAEELDPTLRYDKIYTFVSGMFDYDMRVGCNNHELIVSLDQYILPYTQKFNYFNTPLYLVKQSRKDYLVTDCMAAIARQHIEIPQDKDMSMLDYMIAEGKAIYFAQLTVPDAPDSILMRYTDEQMKWMEKNEENVWTYLLQNKVLYDVDFMRFHNLIDDAPKTNAFNESSPRTPYYIGWRIVSMYAKNTGCSIAELFAETDGQKILGQSNYRPK